MRYCYCTRRRCRFCPPHHGPRSSTTAKLPVRGVVRVLATYPGGLQVAKAGYLAAVTLHELSGVPCATRWLRVSTTLVNVVSNAPAFCVLNPCQSCYPQGQGGTACLLKGLLCHAIHGASGMVCVRMGKTSRVNCWVSNSRVGRRHGTSWACCGPAQPLCLVYVCWDAMLALRHSPQLTPSTPNPSIPHRGQAPLCRSLTYKATSTCTLGRWVLAPSTFFCVAIQVLVPYARF